MQYPAINPIALDLGIVKIHWYGIMYLIGFAGAWWLGCRRAAARDDWDREQVSDLIFYGAMGVVVGGRVGYMLFYNLAGLLENPVSLLYISRGGMSFHGGFLGVIAAVFLFARKYGKSAFEVLDFGGPFVPIGLGAGRLGNFIGGELWGRVTEQPWGMVFPGAGALPRHPSQLYEAGLEGLVLFWLLWWFSSKPRPAFAVSGLFCIGYGAFRFFVEFFREPDNGIFFAFGWLTKGMLLSAPMIIAGMLFMFLAYTRNTFDRSAVS